MPWNEHFLLRNFSYRNSVPNLSNVTGFNCSPYLNYSSDCMTHTGRGSGFQISHQFGRLRVYTDIICFFWNSKPDTVCSHWFISEERCWSRSGKSNAFLWPFTGSGAKPNMDYPGDIQKCAPTFGSDLSGKSWQIGTTFPPVPRPLGLSYHQIFNITLHIYSLSTFT